MYIHNVLSLIGYDISLQLLKELTIVYRNCQRLTIAIAIGRMKNAR